MSKQLLYDYFLIVIPNRRNTLNTVSWDKRSYQLPNQVEVPYDGGRGNGIRGAVSLSTAGVNLGMCLGLHAGT